jgi:hypothetical protein
VVRALQAWDVVVNPHAGVVLEVAEQALETQPQRASQRVL